MRLQPTAFAFTHASRAVRESRWAFRPHPSQRTSTDRSKLIG
jgi:hypothetical protein